MARSPFLPAVPPTRLASIHSRAFRKSKNRFGAAGSGFL